MKYRSDNPDQKTVIRDCVRCGGSGVIVRFGTSHHEDYSPDTHTERCNMCGGCGFVEAYQVNRQIGKETGRGRQ